jgi:uncharacterized membrane protein YedE/YeeE
MIEFLSQPWPWFVAGPLIGLTVLLLLLLGGKAFGVSSSLQHICAATVPGRSSYLHYDWRKSGLWNLVFVAGIVLGGALASTLLAGADSVAISEATKSDLAALGLAGGPGLVPTEIYSLAALKTPAGFIVLVVGGFLVGFGARYAGGCTSGHAIMGLANFQRPSLIAVLGFFTGGLVATHFLLPLFLRI